MESAWEALQNQSHSALVLNQPGLKFRNWRLLVEQLSESVMMRRIDDAMGGGDGQPGLPLTLASPGLPQPVEFMAPEGATRSPSG